MGRTKRPRRSKRITHSIELSASGETQMLLDILLVADRSKKSVFSKGLRTLFSSAKKSQTLELIMGVEMAEAFYSGATVAAVYEKYVAPKKNRSPSPAKKDEEGKDEGDGGLENF